MTVALLSASKIYAFIQNTHEKKRRKCEKKKKTVKMYIIVLLTSCQMVVSKNVAQSQQAISIYSQENFFNSLNKSNYFLYLTLHFTFAFKEAIFYNIVYAQKFQNSTSLRK